MSDPWGSFQNFMNSFSQMMSNPAQYMMQKYGIPKEIADNPNAIMQNLMSSGKLTQQQYNAAQQAAMKIQNNPLFGKMLKK